MMDFDGVGCRPFTLTRDPLLISPSERGRVKVRGRGCCWRWFGGWGNSAGRVARAYPCVRFAPRPLSLSERGRWAGHAGSVRTPFNSPSERGRGERGRGVVDRFSRVPFRWAKGDSFCQMVLLMGGFLCILVISTLVLVDD